MIELNSIKKKYGKEFQLDIPKLIFENKKIYALLGENGAGKTTTIRILLGLLKPDEGIVYFDGLDIMKQKELKREIGYVPDVPNLYEALTGMEYIEYISKLYGVMDKEYILQLMNRLDLLKKKDELIYEYSKGMKQKISIISALVHNPTVLILDEPFTGLDPIAVKEMKNILVEFCDQGKIIIFSTHDLDVADTICTDAVVISHGNVVTIENKNDTNGQKFEESFFKLFKKEESHEQIN